MTSPDRLLSAIRAALDDTERLARDAVADNATGHWHIVGQQGFLHEAVTDRTGLRLATGSSFVQRHIARHDPAAVLRWVAAMREIVDLHHSQPASGFDADGWEHHGHGCAVCYFADSYPCPTIRSLARGLGIDPEETPDGRR